MIDRARRVCWPGESCCTSILSSLRSSVRSADAPASELASVLAYLAWAQALTGDREGALASIEPLKALIRDRLDTSSQSSQLAAIALVGLNACDDDPTGTASDDQVILTSVSPPGGAVNVDPGSPVVIEFDRVCSKIGCVGSDSHSWFV